MKKQLALLLIPILVLVAGCSLLKPTLEVTPSELTGMVDVESGGFLARWIVTGGEGELFVEFGDGGSDQFLGQGEAVLIEHLYTQAGTFKAVFIRGGSAKSMVTITAPDFELGLPFWHQGPMVDRWEKILFDPFPRTTGCDNGAPTDFYGVWPENKVDFQKPGPFGPMFDTDKLSEYFEIRVITRNIDGNPGHVYGKSGEEIAGQWVPLQTFRILADWGQDAPLYPLIVLPKAVAVLGCGDDTCVDDPWVFVPPPTGTPTIFLRMEIRSAPGVFHAVQWEMWVAGGCE